jgi:hypothetical protein
MPLLATFLLNVFTGVVAWFAKWLTQKTAIALVLVAAFSALFVALYASLNALMATSLVALGDVHPMFAVGVAMIVSPHTVTLISSYLTFWSLVELYKWKVNLLQIWTHTI